MGTLKPLHAVPIYRFSTIPLIPEIQLALQILDLPIPTLQR